LAAAVIEPHHLLIQVSARLFADGHTTMAQDVRQLAHQWTPEQERRLVGGETIDKTGAPIIR
jgi:hypothetical protein